MTIYICTNEELLMFQTNEAQEDWQREACVEDAISVAGNIITDECIETGSVIEWKHSSSFRDWSGGRHSQFHKIVVPSLVAYTNDDEREAAERAADAMTERLEGGA